MMTPAEPMVRRRVDVENAGGAQTEKHESPEGPQDTDAVKAGG